MGKLEAQDRPGPSKWSKSPALPAAPALFSLSYFRWKASVLKYLHSRPILILICTLVVVECICVMVELMVDLQGIKFRFENEEKEINKFLDYLEEKYPDDFAYHHGKTLEEVLYMLRDRVVLVTPENGQVERCVCEKQPSELNYPQGEDFRDTDLALDRENGARTLEDLPKLDRKVPPDEWLDNIQKASHDSNTRNMEIPEISGNFDQEPTVINDKKEEDDNHDSIFIFEVNNVKDSFFLAARYKGFQNVSRLNDPDAHLYEEYHAEYKRIHSISHGIHIASLVILSVMVLETTVKLICLGATFFKKKFEVFDAFIVIASFALDFIFLDSRWYETGKDATTILVLLLPWRVVRIVNSFLMTLNHKHQIEIMTIKRARKRCEIKISKLRGLLSEIRRDVDLLVELSRSKGAREQEISSCIYGKGRGVATLTAFASFASLMFISTLGKDPCDVDGESSLYEKVLNKALKDDDDDDDDEDEESETENNNNDNGMDYDLESVSVGESSEETSYATDSLNWRRRYTIPRRLNSADDIHNKYNSVYYVNNGFISQSENCNINRHRNNLHSKPSLRSLPVIPNYRMGKNIVTFEFTTQVTYL
ncbi:hypothetical protein ScPMuIL_015727 [Solemya velum]